MVYEFYRNPTVGFLKFYFTKYEFLPSPGICHTITVRRKFAGFRINFSDKVAPTFLIIPTHTIRLSAPVSPNEVKLLSKLSELLHCELSSRSV